MTKKVEDNSIIKTNKLFDISNILKSSDNINNVNNLIRKFYPPSSDCEDKYNHINKLLKKEEYEKALHETNLLIENYPNWPPAWDAKYIVLDKLRRYEESLVSAKKTFSLSENFYSGILHLGNAYLNNQLFSEAVKVYNYLLEKNGLDLNEQFQINIYLMNLHNSLSEYEKTVSIGKKLVDEKFSSYLLYMNLGVAYSFLKKNKDSLFYYKKALKFEESSEVFCSMGENYVELNKKDEAKKFFKKSLEINDDFAPAFYGLSIMRYDYDSAYLQKMEDILNDSINDPETYLINQTETLRRILKKGAIINELGYGLFNAFQTKKDYDRAFLSLKKANDYHFKTIDPKIIKKEINHLKGFPIYFPESLYLKDIKNKKGKNMIFVLGLPRSGSTLVEQILSSHSQVTSVGESDLLAKVFQNIIDDKNLIQNSNYSLTENEILMYADQYLKAVEDISEDKKANIIIDKMPTNFRLIGLIKLLLPEAKIVHTIRNPKDNCFSIYSTLFGFGHYYSYNLNDISAYFNSYKQLMNDWSKNLGEVYYDLSYEKLVSNFDDEVKKLLKYCNINFEDKILRFYENESVVKTASKSQVREKIYSRSVNRWKNYEDHLDALEALVD